jgi:type I restriction enzyme S subunit
MSLSRYPRYPAYKDSGVEWLGEVPAHWEVRRTDAILRYDKRQVEPSSLPSDEVFHYSIPIIHQTGDGQNEPVNSIDSAKLLITAERVLVSKLNPRKGMVLLARPHTLPTIASTEFVPFEPLDTDPRWATYLFLSESTRQRISATVRSATRSHQRAEVADVTKLWHAVPSKAEQENIANFLDRETARIDALIEKKRRLIELLQEQRAAIITRAVTRGLDPHAPMKNSGVEWLGEIPAHWDVRRLKFLARVPLKYGASESADLDDPELPRFIRITDITDQGQLRDDTFKSLPEDVAQEFLLADGDILLARSGATAGKSFLYREKFGRAAYAGYLIRMRSEQELLVPEFLRFYTASTVYWRWISANTIQSTIPNVSAEKYASLLVPLPTVEEQRAITYSAQSATSRLDQVIQRIDKAVRSLLELRSSLITAAVTGAIDVRTTSTGPGDADAA